MENVFNFSLIVIHVSLHCNLLSEDKDTKPSGAKLVKSFERKFFPPNLNQSPHSSAPPIV